jgi:hypothetical protein
VGDPFGLKAASPFGEEVVSLVQPYAARKRYLCPGCEGFIAPGEGHLVVVPEHAPDLRRHWHHGCWFREQRQRRGRGPT